MHLWLGYLIRCWPIPTPDCPPVVVARHLLCFPGPRDCQGRLGPQYLRRAAWEQSCQYHTTYGYARTHNPSLLPRRKTRMGTAAPIMDLEFYGQRLTSSRDVIHKRSRACMHAKTQIYLRPVSVGRWLGMQQLGFIFNSLVFLMHIGKATHAHVPRTLRPSVRENE